MKSNDSLLKSLLFVASILLLSTSTVSCSKAKGDPAEPASAAAPSTNLTQWRLIWKSDPATSATVSWSTPDAGKLHQVHLRRDGQPPETIVCQRSGAFDSSEEKLHYHHARLTSLQPDTKYYVTLESDTQKSREFWFMTAPAEDKPLKLIFGGDSRSDPAARRQVNQMMAELVAKDPTILCFAHGGDYIYDGRNFPQWHQWLSDHELTATRDGRLVPIVPTRGNHDLGPLYDEIFDFPVGDTNYFAINVGPQMRLITLNTEISTAGDQRKWLAEELASSRPKNRFVIAQYHKPAFPAIKRPSGAKQHWVPLFEQHNVDLVCEADGHNIKRTLPIRGDKHDPTGIVYIGEGGLGVPQRDPKRNRWFLQPPGMVDKGHHVHLISFTPEELQCQAILLDGTVRDDYRQPIREKK